MQALSGAGFAHGGQFSWLRDRANQVDLWYLLTIPVIIFAMQQMAKRDEMIFRLLGLRWLFRMRARNLQRYSGMWVFSPNEYRKNPPGKSR
ncbi:VirB3 family type IV secretion system protein [Xanthomonas citri]|uniref:VirB3 family type IV secretion system protein n=1 Tax=Xanthomonas citri TaxID=346 RepID=UPI00278C76D1|nr:VirB3 family type IV secretion system protein [Xanthomonas citri]